MPNLVWGTHAGGPTGGFGGAPHGATERTGWVTIPNPVSGTHADGPTGEHRWGSLWGHEALCWVGDNAKLAVRDACGRSHWGL
eukprot:9387408-Pyramimonas_sp.AAC.1